jgi:hypothetical protein
MRSQNKVPLIQILDNIPEIPFEQLEGVLKEIDERHWGAVRQILIEAKWKAEAQLRNDRIVENHGLCAYYQGMVNEADYILANLEGLRSGVIQANDQVQAVPITEP